MAFSTRSCALRPQRHALADKEKFLKDQPLFAPASEKDSALPTIFRRRKMSLN